LARAVGFMVLVLHALNERFFLNEKNSFIESQGFGLCPVNFHRDVENILGRLGGSAAELSRSVATIRAIASGLRALCEERYPPGSSLDQTIMADKQLAGRVDTIKREP